jgi:hypothetical protein
MVADCLCVAESEAAKRLIFDQFDFDVCLGVLNILHYRLLAYWSVKPYEHGPVLNDIDVVRLAWSIEVEGDAAILVGLGGVVVERVLLLRDPPFGILGRD